MKVYRANRVIDTKLNIQEKDVEFVDLPVIYNFDKETGEFLSITTADEDPLDPSNYLMPAHSTIAPVPEDIKGKARVFVDGNWNYIDDHRGISVSSHDGTNRFTEIRELGVKPEDITFEKVELTKEQKIAMAMPSLSKQVDTIMTWVATGDDTKVKEMAKTIQDLKNAN